MTDTPRSSPVTVRRTMSAWLYCVGACIVSGWLASKDVPLIPLLGGILIGGAIMMRLGWIMEDRQ